MEYYSAIKKNTFESVLMRWMKLEPIIQSEVSQKEKHQYSILTQLLMRHRACISNPAQPGRNSWHRPESFPGSFIPRHSHAEEVLNDFLIYIT